MSCSDQVTCVEVRFSRIYLTAYPKIRLLSLMSATRTRTNIKMIVYFESQIALQRFILENWVTTEAKI